MVAVAAAAADIAVGVQTDGAAGAVRVRRAGPLGFGSPVQIGNLERAGDGQGGALHIKPACRLAQLGGRQQENGIRSGAYTPATISRGVVILGGADERADVSVQHIQIGAVQPGPHGAACPGVHIGAVPLPVVIAVLADHQGPPGPIKFTFIVVFGNIEVHHIIAFV